MASPIHMIYFPWGKDQKLLPDHESFDHRPYENMVRYAPGFDVTLWTYPRARAFCLSNYPEVWALMQQLARPTMMVDVLRWLAVYHFGGIYWQYDMNPLVAMDRFLPGAGREARVFTEFVNDESFCRAMASEPIRRGEPEEPVRLMNQCFSAVPRQRFIKAVLDLILERARTLVPQRDYDILFICANAAVSTAYDRFGRNDPLVELVSREETRRLLRVQYKGTWRKEAGANAPTPPGASARHRAVRLLKRGLRGLPGVARGYHRLARAHPHEALFAAKQPPPEWSAPLVAEVRRWMEDLGIRSVVEFPWGGRGNETLFVCAERRYVGGHPVREGSPGSMAGARFMNPQYMAIPRADLVICRDYCEYLAHAEIHTALRRMARSGTTYLLLSTHPLLNSQWDTVPGDGRPLHFELAPFSFPPPIRLAPAPDAQGRPDRSLGLWKVADLWLR